MHLCEGNLLRLWDKCRCRCGPGDRGREAGMWPIGNVAEAPQLFVCEAHRSRLLCVVHRDKRRPCGRSGLGPKLSLLTGSTLPISMVVCNVSVEQVRRNWRLVSGRRSALRPRQHLPPWIEHVGLINWRRRRCGPVCSCCCCCRCKCYATGTCRLRPVAEFWPVELTNVLPVRGRVRDQILAKIGVRHQELTICHEANRSDAPVPRRQLVNSVFGFI